VRALGAAFSGDDMNAIATKIDSMRPDVEKWAGLINTQCELTSFLI
jgi:hypothetical protein